MAPEGDIIENMPELTLVCQEIEKVLIYETESNMFFMKCAASTAHPIGRKIFESFSKESRINQDRLDRLYKTYYKNGYAQYSTKIGITKYSSPYARIPSGNLDASENLLPVLEYAGIACIETAELYKSLSEIVADKTLKRFFSNHSIEKRKNAGILRTQYEYIKGTGCYAEYKY
jgi:hypothetical protein